MLESFLPQTNTFVVTNGEIGFSLKELSAITELPILGKLYEEFMPIDSVLEEQSEEFRYFQLDAFYDFLNEREGLKVWCSSWKSGSLLTSNFFDSRESSESTTQEARAKNPGSKKISAMRKNLKEFFVNTDAIHSDIMPRRDLTIYLTYWLGEAVFCWRSWNAHQAALHFSGLSDGVWRAAYFGTCDLLLFVHRTAGCYFPGSAWASHE